jgi:hypothetical protein
MILKVMYSLFLALLVSLFVGFGISAFYPAPKEPSYSPILDRPILPNEQESAEIIAEREKHHKEQEAYQKALSVYNRNASVMALGAAIIILVVSLLLRNTLLMISDGILLGGVFTLIYSIIRGFAGDSTMFRFVVVSVGLIVALILGYIKFIHPEKSNS